MAYDRYDPRDAARDERSRWREERYSDRGRDWRGESRQGGPEDRGFFERAGDEISSWFGDEDAELRRREDRMREERAGRYDREYSGDYGRDRGEPWRGRTWSSDRDAGRPRGRFEGQEDRLRSSAWTGRKPERGTRPLASEYGGGEGFYSAGGYPRRDYDPHYRSWRQRHLDELDRDYDDYRRENQSRFESDFGSWRERRLHKRALLGQIREHMEVVGNDDSHVGSVDRVAGDRIVLTKSDPESGGVHHSLSCSDIDRVEGDRVVLDCSAEQARHCWRDESRSRALFEREDQGEIGPRVLDRSFEGTYR